MAYCNDCDTHMNFDTYLKHICEKKRQQQPNNLGTKEYRVADHFTTIKKEFL